MGFEENNVPMAGAFVFAPIRHPVLRTIGRVPIQKFLKEREAYLLTVEEARSQGSSFAAVSLVSSIDANLLRNLIDLDTFAGVSERTQLTDENLNEWLTSRCTVPFSTIDPEELCSQVKCRVQMRVGEKDADCRIRLLFADYMEFLRERNIQCLPSKNCKVSVVHICSVLRPPALKQKIERDLELEQTHLKKDWKRFFNHVLEHAKTVDMYIPAWQKEFKGKVPNDSSLSIIATVATTKNLVVISKLESVMTLKS